MADFPQEIASFPFYSTFSQILMAGVNANQAAQLSYIKNLQMIAFKPNNTPAPGGNTVFNLSGDLNYVEFDSDLETKVPQIDANTGEPKKDGSGNIVYDTKTTKKYIKVPLISIVDVRPMAIDKLTADLSIKLKSEMTQTNTSNFKFDEAIDAGLDLGFLNVKSHTEISYQTSSSQTQGTTREYNLEVHMEASTQPLNAPLKNIIDYLIRAA